MDHQPSKYNPPFPPSAQNLIMSYHRAHSNSLRLAHFIGPGAEIIVPFLADYFQHIHISHTDTSRIRERLGEFYQTNWHKAKFSFSNGSMENSHLGVAKGSVDLCFLLAPEGWRDVDQVVDAVAESLAPNGTMAVVTWNIPALEYLGLDVAEDVLIANDRLRENISDILRRERGEKCMALYGSALDFIPLRHEQGDAVWIQDVTKRIKINFYDESDNLEDSPFAVGDAAESRVGPKQRKYWFEDKHEEGKGWRTVVDRKWFRGWAQTLVKKEDMGLLEKNLGVIEKGDKELFVVQWAASIVLATRK